MPQPPSSLQPAALSHLAASHGLHATYGIQTAQTLQRTGAGPAVLCHCGPVHHLLSTWLMWLAARPYEACALCQAGSEETHIVVTRLVLLHVMPVHARQGSVPFFQPLKPLATREAVLLKVELKASNASPGADTLSGQLCSWSVAAFVLPAYRAGASDIPASQGASQAGCPGSPSRRL